jgi:hypothetical protein
VFSVFDGSAAFAFGKGGYTGILGIAAIGIGFAVAAANRVVKIDTHLVFPDLCFVDAGGFLFFGRGGLWSLRTGKQ